MKNIDFKQFLIRIGLSEKHATQTIESLKTYSIELKTSVVVLIIILSLYVFFVSGVTNKEIATYAGIANVGILFVVAQMYNRAKQRRDSTKDRAYHLFFEWHSHEIRESRIYVSRWLQANEGKVILPSLSCIEIYATEQYLKRYNERKLEVFKKNKTPRPLELDDPEKHELHFFRIYQFFERWSILVEQNEIDQFTALKLLTTYTNWYKENFIEPWSYCETNKYIQASLNRVLRLCFTDNE